MSKKIFALILMICVTITGFSSVAYADGIVVEQSVAGISVSEITDGIKLTGTADSTNYVFVKVTDGTNVVYVNQFTFTKGSVEQRCYFTKPSGTMHVYLNNYTPVGGSDINVEKDINSEGIILDVRESEQGVQLYGTVDCDCPAFIKITDKSGNVIYINQYNFTKGDVLEDCKFIWPDVRSINVSIYARDSSVIIKDIYVSPTGDDSNAGTITAPFKTLSRVQQEIENIRDTIASDKEEDVTVYLMGGTYYSDAESLLSVNSSNGGTDNISVLYKAYGDEKVYLSAGVNVPYSAFGQVTDSVALSRIPASVQDKVLCADLTGLGIKDYGSHIHFDHQISYDEVNQSELFVDGNAMTVARWPNEGFAYTGYTSETNTSDSSAAEVVVESVEDRAKNWANEKYGQAEIFVDQNFSTRFTDITSVDASTGYFNVSRIPNYTITRNKRYYVFNILEELDTAGEYYIDKDNNKLYYYPDSSFGAASSVTLSANKNVVSLDNTTNIAFENLVFQDATSRLVSVTNSSNITFTDCVFRNSGNAGIYCSDSSGVVVKNSKIYNTGLIGAFVGGGNLDEFVNGTSDTLVYGNNVIDSCEIYNTSRWTSTTGHGVFLYGAGNEVKDSVIYDINHAAVVFRGLEHKVTGNEIYNVCKTVNDAGAIYSGRYIYTRGNVVSGNYIHDVKGYSKTVFGIYFDDKLSDNTITDNIFINNTGAIRVSGGRSVNVTDNFIYNCSRSINYPSYTDVNLTISDYEALSDAFKLRYPDVTDVISDDNPSYPKNSVVTGNVIYNSAEPDIGAEVEEYAKEYNVAPCKDIAIYFDK